jgi:hypothetical protein
LAERGGQLLLVQRLKHRSGRFAKQIGPEGRLPHGRKHLLQQQGLELPRNGLERGRVGRCLAGRMLEPMQPIERQGLGRAGGRSAGV